MLNNKDLSELITEDDSFYCNLGVALSEVLINADLLSKQLTNTGKSSTRQDFIIKHSKMINSQLPVKYTPFNLPMIVPPKYFGPDKLGGYLLNDVREVTNMIKSRQAYKVDSPVYEENKLYFLINNASKIPFKVNKELLEFVLSDEGNFLLMQSSQLKKYEEAPYIYKYKKDKYASLNSKFINIDYILNIDDIYKDFNAIYFTVKLDTRGTLYTQPAYLNYQSSHLAKALLLFSVPGRIHKSDLDCVDYMKS